MEIEGKPCPFHRVILFRLFYGEKLFLLLSHCYRTVVGFANFAIRIFLKAVFERFDLIVQDELA